jgi:ribonuclease D
VDAERASGHRYGQRAFLVQLRREGAGTALVDPALLPDLTPLGVAIADAEWVLHAATQDLPCLTEVGLRPKAIFDTELGGRLAGRERVGLAAMVEQELGLLLAQGKLGWAREEFAAIVAAPPPPPRVDPWRRTSGLHRVRSRRQLAVVREMWLERDDIARDRDVSPGRLLPDSAIVEAALHLPATPAALAELTAFTGRGARRYSRRWADAVKRAKALADTELPPQHLPAEGPPPTRLWSEREPAAAIRLATSRAALTALSTQHRIPVENLLSPDTARRLAWQPPLEADEDGVAGFLRGHGAREWQVALAAGPLSKALTEPAG